MTLKKILSVVLGVTALGLFSCASDLNNEDNTVISPEKSVRRTLTISTNADEQTSASAKSRSIVSLVDGNKWEDGDVFLAYNISEPRSVASLTAKSTGNETMLTGDIECKDNDKIGVFYPYKLSYGSAQYKVHVSMLKGVVTENHQEVDKDQDGTLETIKYFDYSYGTATVKAAQEGRTASGSVAMKKLYAVLHLDFTAGGAKLNNIKKLTLSNVIEEARFNVLTGQFEDLTMGAITITPASSRSEFDVAVFPDQNFKPEFTVVTDEGKTYKFEVKTGLKVNGADYLPFTVAVKEFTPYIEIDNIKWGKYNLQYTPGSKTEGWIDGYHLAKNPWDYFYMEEDPLNLSPQQLPQNKDNVAFDHFRWGDVSQAHNYSGAQQSHYDVSTGNIQGKVSNGEYGDLAYYASNHKWKLPTKADYESLMKHTAQYVGYYSDGQHDVFGVLFVPKPTNTSEIGYIVTKQGKTNTKSGQTGSLGHMFGTGSNDYARNNNTKMFKFTKEDLDKGIFFPAAGSYQDYNDGNPTLANPGRQALYWTADGVNAEKASVFTFSYITVTNGQLNYATVGKIPNSKRAMYSIRPIYVGQ